MAARKVRRACTGALLAFAAAKAPADPAADVFTPYTDVGRWQVAYALGTEHGRDGTRETQQVLSLGGVPVARWYTSVYAAWAAQDGGAYALDEWTWVNHLRLTPPDPGPLDVGALCEIARPHDRSEGRVGLSCGPTLQLDTDGLQVNLNLSLGRNFGAAAPEKPALGYQWQVKGGVAHGVELGAQGFGSVGTWTDWAPASQQEHTVGPALFLKTRLLGNPTRIDAAWLLGIGDGSPRNVARMRVQYVF
jgi:hypothetical protein